MNFKLCVEFLAELSANNSKTWFDQNRSRYKEVQGFINEQTERLIELIALFDPGVRGVTVKESTYRIYRDIRFSPNKTPYKTHIGIYICPGGKKSGNAGYYLHIEPGQSLLAIGLHCPEPKIVKSIREDIFSLFDQFCSSIKGADGFELDMSSSLKRTPREFPADAKSADFLKLKEFDLIMPMTDKQIFDKDLIDNVARAFRSGKPFNDFMNRAITIAREENNE